MQSHIQGEYKVPGEMERLLVGSPFSFHPKSHNKLPDGNSRWDIFQFRVVVQQQLRKAQPHFPPGISCWGLADWMTSHGKGGSLGRGT